MEDEEGSPERCDCITDLLAVVRAEDGGVAAWCLWCGIGFGKYELLLTKPGEPMPEVTSLDVIVPTFPLIGKYDTWSPEC